MSSNVIEDIPSNRAKEVLINGLGHTSKEPTKHGDIRRELARDMDLDMGDDAIIKEYMGDALIPSNTPVPVVMKLSHQP